MFDIHVPDHNRYLKGLFAQIKEEGMDDDLFHMLAVELKYSMVDHPTHDGNPFFWKMDGKYYLALFTSIDEKDIDFSDHISGCHQPFEKFLEYLNVPARAYMDDGTGQIITEGKGDFPSGIVTTLQPTGSSSKAKFLII